MTDPTRTLTRYSSAEVCEMTGVTYRMLDHACRRGCLGPDPERNPSPGYRRTFSGRDVVAVALIAEASSTVRTLSGQHTGVSPRVGGALWRWATTTDELLTVNGSPWSVHSAMFVYPTGTGVVCSPHVAVDPYARWLLRLPLGDIVARLPPLDLGEPATLPE